LGGGGLVAAFGGGRRLLRLRLRLVGCSGHCGLARVRWSSGFLGTCPGWCVFRGSPGLRGVRSDGCSGCGRLGVLGPERLLIVSWDGGCSLRTVVVHWLFGHCSCAVGGSSGAVGSNEMSWIVKHRTLILISCWFPAVCCLWASFPWVPCVWEV